MVNPFKAIGNEVEDIEGFFSSTTKRMRQLFDEAGGGIRSVEEVAGKIGEILFDIIKFFEKMVEWFADGVGFVSTNPVVAVGALLLTLHLINYI